MQGVLGILLVVGGIILVVMILGDLASWDPLHFITGPSGGNNIVSSASNPGPSVKATAKPTGSSNQRTVAGTYCPPGYTYNGATGECFVPQHT